MQVTFPEILTCQIRNFIIITITTAIITTTITVTHIKCSVGQRGTPLKKYNDKCIPNTRRLCFGEKVYAEFLCEAELDQISQRLYSQLIEKIVLLPSDFQWTPVPSRLQLMTKL